MKIIGICRAYNEVEKGNLEIFLKNFWNLCDSVILYNDGSTDDTSEIAALSGCIVIQGKENDPRNELQHKKLLLEEARKLNPDWILDFDCDEIADKRLQEDGMRKLLEKADSEGIEQIAFSYYNLWRSECFRRTDVLCPSAFVRAFKPTKQVHFGGGYGYHLDLRPKGLENPFLCPESEGVILHRGYATLKNILWRWKNRPFEQLDKSSQEARKQIMDESKITLEHIPHELFPDELKPKECIKPEPKKFWDGAIKYEKDTVN